MAQTILSPRADLGNCSIGGSNPLATTIARQWSKEEWQRMNDLMYGRLRSRLWLMHEALNLIRSERCGENVEICATTLEGVYFIVDDMLKEMNEVVDILNF